MCARRSGFTLIEILVVMAIIAVIAALSSAVWQRSQRVAKAAACMQNVKIERDLLLRIWGTRLEV